MFTIRLVDKRTDSKRTEYNALCERYEKHLEEDRIDCWGTVGFDDSFMQFDVNGHPWTHAYIMNPEGKTIDTMRCLVNVHSDDEGNTVGVIPEKQ